MFCLLALQAEMPVDWQKQVIYFVILDRFYNGDPSNDIQLNPTDNPAYTFHGGDLAGLIQKLPYLKDLGITTIWLSPIFDNRDTSFEGKYAYHGYWVKDFNAVEEHLGTLSLFQELGQKAKANGINLVLDMVINHMDYDTPFLQQHPEYFHDTPSIVNWDDPTQLLNYRLHGLPDLAQERPEVAQYLMNVSKYWIEAGSLQGFRMDAVKHVPETFWSWYNQELQKAYPNFFLLGEHFEGDPKRCAVIWRNGKFSSLFDFPLYYVLHRVIAEEGTAEELGTLFEEDKSYANPNYLATFLDNHDRDRFFTTVKGDVAKFKLGLAMLFSVRGIPTLYYGTEIAMSGRDESHSGCGPENRQDMQFDPKSEVAQNCLAYTKALIQLRCNSEALTQGVQMHLFQHRAAYSFARISPNEIALVVLNNHRESQRLVIPLAFLSKQIPAIQVQDPLHQVTGQIQKGYLVSELPAKTCAIFLIKASEKDQYKTLIAQYQIARQTPQLIPVTCEVEIPQLNGQVALIGGHSIIGNWNPSQAYGPMQQTCKTTYSITIPMPQGSIMPYKYIQNFQTPGKDIIWELGMTNRYVQVPWEGTITIHEVWNKY